MAVVSLVTLKTYFETGYFPTEQNFIDLIDTLGQQNNLRTVEYTVGVAGVTGVDYNFTSVANTTEQSIQLGGTTIIPANSIVSVLIAKCVVGLNGAITGTSDIGITSGSNDYLAAANIDDTNEIVNGTGVGSPSSISSSATSVYFSFTPSANWSTITTGEWKIWITYIDNSLL